MQKICSGNNPSPITLYRIFFSIIACFAFIFSFDLFLHVVLLMPSYLSVDVIRNAAPIDAARHQWHPIFQLMQAIVITVFYVCWRYRGGATASKASCGTRYSDGAGFGGFAGLLSGLTLASLYIYLPIPGTLAVAWAIGEMAKGVGLGLVLTALYPQPPASAA